MPSFRLLSSIWKIPASKVSRTRPPYWLAFVWLRLRREKWKRCVRTYGCWVKFVAVVDGIFTRCPQSSFPSVSWRSLCLLGGHLLTVAGTLYRHVCSMLTRLFDWWVGAGTEVTRPAIAYTASVIVIRISNLVILVRNELYSKSSTALGKNHTASE